MRIPSRPCLLLLCSIAACSADQSGSADDGAHATASLGGASGGASGSGATPSTGGLVQGTGASSAAGIGGGTTGDATTGGAATGGMATGGAVAGGVSTGGAASGGLATGGMATGGAVAGGVSTGDVVTGGAASGGAATGGDSTGGLGGMTSGGTPSGGAAVGGAVTGGTGAAPITGGSDSSGGAPTGGTAGSAGAETTGGGPVSVDTDSLREKYEAYFSIGAAIDTQYPSYAAILEKHFSRITCENEMKFDALQPSEGDFTFDAADQMVGFAQSHGIEVRGHALVWHRQTPSWVFSGGRDAVLRRMRNHIHNVLDFFQGGVYAWDVVNEAIMDDGTYRTGSEDGADQSSQWYATIGEDYIAQAFRYAREADPDVKLFYNDYYNYHPVRRQAIYDLLAGLLADGVPIDGVGLQCHLNLAPGTDPNEQSYHQTVENLEAAIEMYASLGLEVQITEMDVSLYLRGITYTADMFYTPENVTPAIFQQQAERYRAFFEMFRRHYDVITSVTFWGIADDNSWLSEFSSGRKDFPLLFDDQHQPKPAFDAVMDF